MGFVFRGNLGELTCSLQGTGGMRKGQTVLITAAAGATGHIGVQLAVLAGCTVIATCGGPKKAAALKKLGVHHIIDYKSQVRFVPLSHVHADEPYSHLADGHIRPLSACMCVGSMSQSCTNT